MASYECKRLRQRLTPDQPVKYYKIVLAALLLFSLVQHWRMLWFQWPNIASGTGDFVAYYTAGKILNSDNFRNLSSFEIQETVQRELSLPGQTAFFPFYHAPYQALLFAPIARFPYPTARLVWGVLNLALLFIVLVILVSVLDSKHKLIDGLILLAAYPTWINFIQGQDAIMSTLILVWVFRCLKTQKDALAGCILALGLYKPQLVLPMGAMVLYGRQWRVAIPFLLVGFLLVCVSVLMLSWQGAIDLITTVVSNLRHGTLDRASPMTNLRALVITLFGVSQMASPANVITAMVSVVLLCGCALLCKNGFGFAYPELDLKFSLVLVTTLLINPHSHAYEFILLLATLIVLLDYVLKTEPKTRFFCESILTVLFLICMPIIPNVLVSYDLISLGALPPLVLYCFIALEIRKWQRAEAH
jgi:hypothetical protein